MVKARTRLTSFWKIWLPVRTRSPSIRSTNKKADFNQGPLADRHDGADEYSESQANSTPIGNSRKIMIVIDSSVESKRAFQWALTHAVQTQDIVILLHVTRPAKQVLTEFKSGAFELANSFKSMCRLSKPEVQVKISMVEGKDRGPLIVEEAKKQGVAVLVLGQKKRSSFLRLVMPRRAPSTVEHCIQNADCIAIAVRRKSRRHGGYLVTTKRHKDFWLLA